MVRENMRLIAECSKRLIELCEKLAMVEEEKPKYPKTYDDCVIYDREGSSFNRAIRLSKLEKLLVCRDAYWKIAGEEMGLGKPWKPDWNNDNQFKYIIICRRDHVNKDTYTAKNCILAFPTEEIRDAFYENFKELIEECKELL